LTCGSRLPGLRMADRAVDMAATVVTVALPAMADRMVRRAMVHRATVHQAMVHRAAAGIRPVVATPVAEAILAADIPAEGATAVVVTGRRGQP
jgi:hypothetical protein